MQKNKFCIFLVSFSIIIFLADCYNYYKNITDEYPSKNINGYIAWGAGGATDRASRLITPLAENYLNQNIILQNKTGATGAIATQYVANQKSDGYSLLYHAENPSIYNIMGISDIDYSYFEPVIIIGREVAVMVTSPNSEYKSIQDVFEKAAQNPNQIKLGTTGTGGLPFNVASMMSTTSDVYFNQVPFDGDSAILTSLMGEHIDIGIVNLSAVIDMYQAGTINIISILDNEHLEEIPEVEPIGKIYNEYQKYFPWGAFYGIFVHKDIEQDRLDILVNSFKEVFKDEAYINQLENSCVIPMGISGIEARDYINKWQQVTTWLLYDANATNISPDIYNIKRLED